MQISKQGCDFHSFQRSVVSGQTRLYLSGTLMNSANRLTGKFLPPAYRRRLHRWLLFLMAVLFFGNAQAQDILLMSEDFESGGFSFTLNSGGPGSNSGNNQWIINNQYSGAPTYPNTTTQDNTAGGTISFAPTSNYLHIHNAPSGITNANYDPTATSDQFAYMTFGFCTYGMEDVHMSFFYLCEGEAGAYGTVWYSVDGGPWIQTGMGQYANTSNWQYQDITDPAFENVGNLRFGFRWQNENGSPPYNMSFSIDDINVVATQSVTDPIEIQVVSVEPNPVCEGSYVTISYELSDTLCDGNYLIELSNSAGNFPSGFTSWVTPINYPTTSGTLSLLLPAGASAGTCYRFRISRTNPDPVITGTASACFEIIECPNEITTMQPVVTLDPNPVCVGSVIDVPFYSTGIYEATNAYVCQLSNPDGTFPANPLFVGSSGDSDTYDPMLGSLPGNVSGIIPETEPGCNYYLRVISTNPDAIGSVWGPFCIQLCDITTNESQDLSFCVTDCAVEPEGQNATVTIDVNEWDNVASYLPGNIFTTQLLSSQSFGQIGGNGILGQVAATGDTELNVHVPCADSLPIYGLPVGMNYMRIISTNSTTPNNALGSLIRVTIGTYSNEPQVITSYEYPTGIPKSVFCVGETAMLMFQPYDYFENSTYMWTCSGINGGAPFESPSGANSNTLYVTLGAPGILTFSIQETNNGCSSPWTPEMEITVLGDPNINISGPQNVCEGDTSLFQVPFIPNTYFSWTTSATADNIAYQDTANNVMNIAFDTPGTYTLTLGVLNACGSDDDSHTVNVLAPPGISSSPDVDICIGESVTLDVTQAAGNSYEWQEGGSTISNTNSVTVSPEETTEYVVTVSSNIGCESQDTTVVELFYPEAPVVYTDSICPGGYNNLRLDADETGIYFWSDETTESYTIVHDTGTYTLMVNVPDEVCPHYAEWQIAALLPDPPVYLTDSVCPNGSASIRLQADSVGSYLWSTGGMNRYIMVSDTGTYTVQIFGADDPCPRTLAFVVIPDTCIITMDGMVYEPIEYWVPNAITPHASEDVNDYFAPVFSNTQLIRDYHLIIYNRWGEVVFESFDPLEKWIANHQGGDYYAEDGVYVWQLEFRNVFEVDKHGDRGHLIVVR